MISNKAYYYLENEKHVEETYRSDIMDYEYKDMVVNVTQAESAVEMAEEELLEKCKVKFSKFLDSIIHSPKSSEEIVS